MREPDGIGPVEAGDGWMVLVDAHATVISAGQLPPVCDGDCMSFGVLALIVLAGLSGPLLGARSLFVPVVVGELLAGVVLGRAGVSAIDPNDVTLRFLSDVGFAMLMFTVGAHLPLRDHRLPASLRGGALAAGLVLLLAPLGGLVAAAATGTGHAAVYAVLLGSGSAAAVLAMTTEARLTGPSAFTVIGQVTIADVVTIFAVPLVLQPGRAAGAALGAVLVAFGAGAVYGVSRAVGRRAWIHALRQRSKHRRWALDLRLSLLALFALAWVAQTSGTSVLVAGFGTGLAVAALGGPKRLFTELRGIADGFFVPLFFVVLGAQLPLDALFRDSSTLGLAAVLLALNVLVHLIAARLTRQSPAAALVATAQLGVPAAVVTLGLRDRVIDPAQAAAIMVAALASIGLATYGTALLARREAAAAAVTGGSAR